MPTGVEESAAAIGSSIPTVAAIGGPIVPTVVASAAPVVGAGAAIGGPIVGAGAAAASVGVTGGLLIAGGIAINILPLLVPNVALGAAIYGIAKGIQSAINRRNDRRDRGRLRGREMSSGPMQIDLPDARFEVPLTSGFGAPPAPPTTPGPLPPPTLPAGGQFGQPYPEASPVVTTTIQPPPGWEPDINSGDLSFCSTAGAPGGQPPLPPNPITMVPPATNPAFTPTEEEKEQVLKALDMLFKGAGAAALTDLTPSAADFVLRYLGVTPTNIPYIEQQRRTGFYDLSLAVANRIPREPVDVTQPTAIPDLNLIRNLDDYLSQEAETHEVSKEGPETRTTLITEVPSEYFPSVTGSIEDIIKYYTKEGRLAGGARPKKEPAEEEKLLKELLTIPTTTITQEEIRAVEAMTTDPIAELRLLLLHEEQPLTEEIVITEPTAAERAEAKRRDLEKRRARFLAKQAERVKAEKKEMEKKQYVENFIETSFSSFGGVQIPVSQQVEPIIEEKFPLEYNVPKITISPTEATEVNKLVQQAIKQGQPSKLSKFTKTIIEGVSRGVSKGVKPFQATIELVTAGAKALQKRLEEQRIKKAVERSIKYDPRAREIISDYEAIQELYKKQLKKVNDLKKQLARITFAPIANVVSGLPSQATAGIINVVENLIVPGKMQKNVENVIEKTTAETAKQVLKAPFQPKKTAKTIGSAVGNILIGEENVKAINKLQKEKEKINRKIAIAEAKARNLYKSVVKHKTVVELLRTGKRAKVQLGEKREKRALKIKKTKEQIKEKGVDVPFAKEIYYEAPTEQEKQQLAKVIEQEKKMKPTIAQQREAEQEEQNLLKDLKTEKDKIYDVMEDLYENTEKNSKNIDEALNKMEKIIEGAKGKGKKIDKHGGFYKPFITKVKKGVNNIVNRAGKGGGGGGDGDGDGGPPINESPFWRYIRGSALAGLLAAPIVIPVGVYLGYKGLEYYLSREKQPPKPTPIPPTPPEGPGPEIIPGPGPYPEPEPPEKPPAHKFPPYGEEPPKAQPEPVFPEPRGTVAPISYPPDAFGFNANAFANEINIMYARGYYG